MRNNRVKSFWEWLEVLTDKQINNRSEKKIGNNTTIRFEPIMFNGQQIDAVRIRHFNTTLITITKTNFYIVDDWYPSKTAVRRLNDYVPNVKFRTIRGEEIVTCPDGNKYYFKCGMYFDQLGYYCGVNSY